MTTWSHNITRQDTAIQGGVDVTVEFERSGTGYALARIYKVENVTAAEVQAKIVKGTGLNL